MKVGDLVYVTLSGIKPYVGVAIATNNKGGHLVSAVDSALEYWVYKWGTYTTYEIISEAPEKLPETTK